MSLQPLVIVGGGGFGRETHDVVEAINELRPTYELLGFVADGPTDEHLLRQRGSALLGPVVTLADLDVDVQYVIGIGSGAARRTIDAYATSLALSAATLVHPAAIVGRHQNELGPGTIVCAGSILTTNIRLGRHCHVNLDSTIGHDCTIGSYSTISPGVHISGRVTLGDEVTVGTGAIILPGKSVGEGATIGAAAAVIADVPAGATAVGVPARVR